MLRDHIGHNHSVLKHLIVIIILGKQVIRLLGKHILLLIWLLEYVVWLHHRLLLKHVLGGILHWLLKSKYVLRLGECIWLLWKHIIYWLLLLLLENILTTTNCNGWRFKNIIWTSWLCILEYISVLLKAYLLLLLLLLLRLIPHSSGLCHYLVWEFRWL